jgi:hypothetical protein
MPIALPFASLPLRFPALRNPTAHAQTGHGLHRRSAAPGVRRYKTTGFRHAWRKLLILDIDSDTNVRNTEQSVEMEALPDDLRSAAHRHDAGRQVRLRPHA